MISLRRHIASNSAVVNQAARMSCSECSRWAGPAVSSVASHTVPSWLDIPGATSRCPISSIRPATSPVSSCSSRTASSAGSCAARSGAVPAGNSQCRLPTG